MTINDSAQNYTSADLTPKLVYITQDADMAVARFTLSPTRAQAMDYTACIFIEGSHFWTHYPAKIKDLFILIRIFHWKVRNIIIEYEINYLLKYM